MSKNKKSNKHKKPHEDIEVINNMSTSTSTKSSIIIFTNTCKRCHEISEILNQMNIYNVILIYIYIYCNYNFYIYIYNILHQYF